MFNNFTAKNFKLVKNKQRKKGAVTFNQDQIAPKIDTFNIRPIAE